MVGKKVLITGFSGFVSHHFCEYLYLHKINCEIMGIDAVLPKFNYEVYKSVLNISFNQIDLLNLDSLRAMLFKFRPDYILHLASFSSVAYSWKNPVKSFENNTNIFLNIATVVTEVCPDCRILSVGSSEEYGNVEQDELPIQERQPLRPNSPYAVARVSQEMLSKIYSDSYHLNIIMTRSFNHIGPWQNIQFVVPSFISQIKAIRDKSLLDGVIETGDISIVRDFVDVRDVVRAYYLLLTKGKCGEIYNICSGNGLMLKNVIEIISEQLGVTVRTKVNPEYVRRKDNRIMIGSNFKIFSETGWKPEIDIHKTIKDMIEQS